MVSLLFSTFALLTGSFFYSSQYPNSQIGIHQVETHLLGQDVIYSYFDTDLDDELVEYNLDVVDTSSPSGTQTYTLFKVFRYDGNSTFVMVEFSHEIRVNIMAYFSVSYGNTEYSCTHDFSHYYDGLNTTIAFENLSSTSFTYRAWFSLIDFPNGYTNVDTNSAIYDVAYNDGFNAGKTVGYDEGFSNGETDGYNIGVSDGYTQGYLQGQTDYANTHDFSFNNLFYAIGDTPILYLRRLFGFSLFGMNVMSIFMSLFTFIIVIHIIKKVF